MVDSFSVYAIVDLVDADETKFEPGDMPEDDEEANRQEDEEADPQEDEEEADPQANEIYVDGVLLENEDGERFWQFNGAFADFAASVVAEAPEEAFAEGAAMRVTKETPDAGALEALLERPLAEARAYDFAFFDAEGAGIDPAEGTEVKMVLYTEIDDTENTVLVRNGGEIVESAEIGKRSVTFYTDLSATYTVATVGPKPVVLDENSRTLTFNGKEVIVTVRAQEGVLPEGAQLVVTVPDSNTLAALEEKYPKQVNSYAGIALALNISFVDENGNEIRPVEAGEPADGADAAGEEPVCEVEIKCPLITDETMVLVRDTEDGVVYVPKATEDGTLTFLMDTFGLYVVTERGQDEIEDAEAVYGTNHLALDDSFFNYWTDKIAADAEADA